MGCLGAVWLAADIERAVEKEIPRQRCWRYAWVLDLGS
jgi:hypothetical protein